jgi:cytochrome c oxidase subunit 2
VGLLGLVAVAVASGCSANFGAPDPNSDQGAQILDLWRFFFWMGLFVGGAVMVLITFAIVSGRRRARRAGAEEPSQQQYSGVLEVFYFGIPIVIVGVLFFFATRAQLDVESVSDSPDLRVEVIGFQWGWEFRYPDEAVVVYGTVEDVPTLVLPADSVVDFSITALDVNHSFYVPGFLYKRDAIVGLDTRFEVATQGPVRGLRGFCAEFCGLKHHAMLFFVDIVPAGEFAAELAAVSDTELIAPPGIGVEQASGEMEVSP